jgi:WD40 repeat protein
VPLPTPGGAPGQALLGGPGSPTLTLATADDEGNIYLWDLTGPARPRSRDLSDHEAAVNALAISPDGRFLATAGEDGRVSLWSTELSKPGRIDMPKIPGGPPANAVAFSPDGRTLPLGKAFGEVLETTITGEGCEFGADGKSRAPKAGCRLAVSGGSGGVKIFDVADLEHPNLLADFIPHPGIAVNDMQFGRKGNILVTAAQDGKILMWDTANPGQNRRPRQVGTPLKGHTGAVRDVEFNRLIDRW